MSQVTVQNHLYLQLSIMVTTILMTRHSHSPWPPPGPSVHTPAPRSPANPISLKQTPSIGEMVRNMCKQNDGNKVPGDNLFLDPDAQQDIQSLQTNG
jgi:hypothetical protein